MTIYELICYIMNLMHLLSLSYFDYIQMMILNEYDRDNISVYLSSYCTISSMLMYNIVITTLMMPYYRFISLMELVKMAFINLIP